MAYKISNKKNKKYQRNEIDDIYDMGEDVVQRSNPCYMTARAMGDEPTKLKKKKRK